MLNYKEMMREEKEKAMKDMLLNSKIEPDHQDASKKSPAVEKETLNSILNIAAGLRKSLKLGTGLKGQDTRENSKKAAEAEVDLNIVLQNVGKSEDDITAYKLDECPAKDLFYIPKVLSDEDCQALLAVIDSQQDNKGGLVQAETLSVWETLDSNWTHLQSRKLQQWGQHSKMTTPLRIGDEKGIHNSFPSWLSKISDQFKHLFPENSEANQCLINQYQPQGGILHHTDGPAYVNNVAVISIGGPMLLTFKPRLLTEDIGVRSSSACCR